MLWNTTLNWHHYSWAAQCPFSSKSSRRVSYQQAAQSFQLFKPRVGWWRRLSLSNPTKRRQRGTTIGTHVIQSDSNHNFVATLIIPQLTTPSQSEVNAECRTRWKHNRFSLEIVRESVLGFLGLRFTIVRTKRKCGLKTILRTFPLHGEVASIAQIIWKIYNHTGALVPK